MLYDRISGRHKKEDDIYNSILNAWEKEQDKKRNEEKRQAKLNARETDIHPDFTPLKSQWNSKDYIATVFDDFKAELSDHLKKKGIKSNHMVTELDSFISSASDRSRPYHMQSALAEILEGDLENFQDNSKN